MLYLHVPLCFALAKKAQISEMAISPVLVWNKTTVFDIYSGARAANKTGNAVSTGININYSRTIYKNFFVNLEQVILNKSLG